MTRHKVLIVKSFGRDFVNSRAGLIRALIAAGYDVVCAAPPGEYIDELIGLGCDYVPIKFHRGSINPFNEFLFIWRLYRLFKQTTPDIILGYTIKVNIYASFVARLLNIPIVNNISGLGFAFIRDNWLTHLVKLMYRVGLSKSTKVFFQNKDDQQLFIEQKLVKERCTDLLPGSGVDLSKFNSAAVAQLSEQTLKIKQQTGVKFLFIGRFLWDKGVKEYIDAAEVVHQSNHQAHFYMLGQIETKNPSAVQQSYVEDKVSQDIIEYLGVTKDIRPFIDAVDCVVLPSYREGLPRCLLEAAAMGKPLIATDVPGCREVVDDRINGFLCKPRDALDLADKLLKMQALTATARKAMGENSRSKVQRQFDVKLVIEKYLSVVADSITVKKSSKGI